MSDLLDDRYELGDALGSGGTGAVRRARDRVLGRDVAVKLLHPGTVGDEVHRVRLREEARLAGALQHHGIARVFDYGEDASTSPPTPYVVMELIEGRSLAAVLREEGALPPDRVRDLVGQVAAALAVAHGAGIVHRDLKPGNVVLTSTGRAVLVDFGIARSTGGEPLTATGTLVGTVDYLSPERAGGASAGPLSDLYALGVLAYECLTGVRPFRRESPVATALAQVRDAAPPLSPVVPADLRRLVEQLMAKDPDDRPQDAAAVAAALAGSPSGSRLPFGLGVTTASTAPSAPGTAAAPVTETLALGPTGTGRGGRRRSAVVGGVAALLLVLGLAVVVGRSGDPAPAAAGGGSGAAAGSGTATADRSLRVPEGLVGLPYAKAARRVRAVGLRPERDEWAAGAADPSLRGLVADVRPGPGAGRLAPGTEVVLVVAVSTARSDRTDDGDPVAPAPVDPATTAPVRSPSKPDEAGGEPGKAEGKPDKPDKVGKPDKPGKAGGGPGKAGGKPGKGKGR